MLEQFLLMQPSPVGRGGVAGQAGIKSEWSVIFLLIPLTPFLASVEVCVCVPSDPLGQLGLWLFDL